MLHANEYLSDSDVKDKWKKEEHCHFCRRICDSQILLKDHLESPDQDECKRCYFVHYRTKVVCYNFASRLSNSHQID